jgi:hypothetical protein
MVGSTGLALNMYIVGEYMPDGCIPALQNHKASIQLDVNCSVH